MKKVRVTAITLVTGLLLTLGLTAVKGDSEQVFRVRSIINTNSAFGTGGTAATGKFHLIDAAGNPIFLGIGLGRLLFTQDVTNPGPISAFPILAPDGHQLTLREWVRAYGDLDVNCIGEGTKYKMRFEGLIPNGVYTVFHFTNMGNGALASHPGDINNTFQASPDGDGVLSVVATPGPATLTGVISQCSLTDVTREFFVVAYNMGGSSCGGNFCGGGASPPQMYFAVK
ncbi:MAG: hypothetical protein L0387_05455 [Acidobacteria bacterium]|nr:hypothetical protein [Acidobacteriota bacterium]